MSDHSTDSFDKLMSAIGLMCLIFLMMPFSVLLWGLLTFKAWEWFMPLLPFALPMLSFKQAILLRILIGMIWPAPVTPKQDNEYAFVVAYAIFTPLMTMMILWVIHCLV
jgi:hypothetical protein